ncbi:MAG: hypothetical protein ACI8WB_005375 [Phenylobacterium sp.]
MLLLWKAVMLCFLSHLPISYQQVRYLSPDSRTKGLKTCYKISSENYILLVFLNKMIANHVCCGWDIEVITKKTLLLVVIRR